MGELQHQHKVFWSNKTTPLAYLTGLSVKKNQIIDQLSVTLPLLKSENNSWIHCFQSDNKLFAQLERPS